MSILVLGYYDKKNLGDDQYKITIPLMLKDCKYKDIIFKNPHSINIQTIKNMKDLKLVICGGGDIINDWFNCELQVLLLNINVPVIALSIGITYESTINNKYLNLYKYIVLRHTDLIDNVAKVIGSSRVSSIPDLGFLLEPSQTPITYNTNVIDIINDINYQTKYIGVFVANGCLSLNDQDIMYNLLTKLNKLKYKIILYNLNYSDEKHEGDQYINDKLNKDEEFINSYNFYKKCNVYEIRHITKVQDMLSCIGGLHLVICVRYHSHIFSIVQGIPFVSLAVRPKTVLLMKDANFTNNVAYNIKDLESKVTWALDNRNDLILNINKVRKNYKSILKNFKLPIDIKKNVEEFSEECIDMFEGKFPYKKTSNEEIVKHALIYCTGTSVNKYSYGFLNNMNNNIKRGDDLSIRKKNIKYMKEMIQWILDDIFNLSNPYKGLTFVQKADEFSGVHRSGWEIVCKHLRCLENNKGTLCDLYVDSTFNWKQEDLVTRGILPYKQRWIGFIHHPFLKGNEDYTIYNAKKLFMNDLFIKSLKHCRLLIVLSDSLKYWIKKEINKLGYINLKVESIKHPTESTNKLFSYKKWNENRTITQIGAWMRNPYSIYALKLKNKQVLHGPKMESYSHPTNWWLINTLNCKCCCCKCKNCKCNNGCTSGNKDCKECKECNECTSGNKDCTSGNKDCKQNHITNVMTEYMTKYIHEQGAPLFLKVKLEKCCDEGVIYPNNWKKKIESINKLLKDNYTTVKKIQCLTNLLYDELLTSTVVFLDLLDCSAANTIIECIVRSTPIIVNSLPSTHEYLGNNYPGLYKISSLVDKLSDVKNIYPEKVKEINKYMKKIDKSQFMIDKFIRNMEEITINL